MDGHAQLRSLALAINGASDVDAAWAGTGQPLDLRKQCGICGEDQPVRVPFLRHVCRACSAIWVPGICGDCAHTSVTFTQDGQLSRYASCGCGGSLRQVAYVPRPRVAVDPEVAAARKVVVERRKKRATWTSRTALVVLAALASGGAWQALHARHAAPTAVHEPVVHESWDDDPTLTMAQRGTRAAHRLDASGVGHDVFSCAGQLPTPAPAPSASPQPLVASAGSKEFLAACLRG